MKLSPAEGGAGPVLVTHRAGRSLEKLVGADCSSVSRGWTITLVGVRGTCWKPAHRRWSTVLPPPQARAAASLLLLPVTSEVGTDEGEIYCCHT